MKPGFPIFVFMTCLFFFSFIFSFLRAQKLVLPFFLRTLEFSDLSVYFCLYFCLRIIWMNCFPWKGGSKLHPLTVDKHLFRLQSRLSSAEFCVSAPSSSHLSTSFQVLSSVLRDASNCANSNYTFPVCTSCDCMCAPGHIHTHMHACMHIVLLSNTTYASKVG